MGADLFESFCGGIIASVQLSTNFYVSWVADEWNVDGANAAAIGALLPGDSDKWSSFLPNAERDVRGLIALPFYIAAFGIICACIGIWFVRTGQRAEKGKNNELQETLLWT